MGKHVNQIFQMVCVVRDRDVTLDNWKRHVEFDTASIKLYSSEDLPGYQCEYKGEMISFPFKAARFNLGGIDMVLVQPLNESGDPYSDVLKKNGQGFHHIGMYMKDPAKAVETCKKWGYDPIACESVNGEAFLLFDLRDKIGLQFTPWDRMIGPCGPRDAQGKTI